MGPPYMKQGTSLKAQVSHFTCTVAGINMFNKPYVFNQVEQINPMRTACRLVKMSIQAYIEPIRECVGEKMVSSASF